MRDSRQWSFVADMNHTGSITISDVWLWIKWLYFYPGDLLIESVNFAINKTPEVARFFENTYISYSHVLAGVISFIVWCFLLFFVLYAYVRAEEILYRIRFNPNPRSRWYRFWHYSNHLFNGLWGKQPRNKD